MNQGLPQRKHPRLKKRDYSRIGSYFITICAENRNCLFSTVGRGLAPAEKNNTAVYIELSQYGKILEEELKNITNRYPYAMVDEYVIMPDHIHFILTLSAGASPRPTVVDIICAYKSIVTRCCKQIGYAEKGCSKRLFLNTSSEIMMIIVKPLNISVKIPRIGSMITYIPNKKGHITLRF